MPYILFQIDWEDQQVDYLGLAPDQARAIQQALEHVTQWVSTSGVCTPQLVDDLAAILGPERAFAIAGEILDKYHTTIGYHEIASPDGVVPSKWERVPVPDSSCISHIEFAPEQCRVYFTNGSAYHYEYVPQVMLDEFRRASSKGYYFNHMIRGRYAAVRIDTPETQYRTEY